MKQYHSIGKQIILGKEAYVFDKLDGSNIRAEWNNKKGFIQFGTRTKIIDSRNEDFKHAMVLVQEKEDKITKELIKHNGKEGTIFFEYSGEKSSFGQHDLSDPTLSVKIIDISLNKKGLLYPKDLIIYTENLPKAELLFHGLLTEEIVHQIKEGKFPGITFEGVIVKMMSGSPGLPDMFKIKTNKWIDLLKEYCKGNTELFEKLL